MKYLINLLGLGLMIMTVSLAWIWGLPLWLLYFNLFAGFMNLGVFAFNNKFDKAIATGFVVGACIGTILSEIFIRPNLLNHLFTADVMLLMAILIGIIAGEING